MARIVTHKEELQDGLCRAGEVLNAKTVALVVLALLTPRVRFHGEFRSRRSAKRRQKTQTRLPIAISDSQAAVSLSFSGTLLSVG